MSQEAFAVVELAEGLEGLVPGDDALLHGAAAQVEEAELRRRSSLASTVVGDLEGRRG
jgi:hypothetical protein